MKEKLNVNLEKLITNFSHFYYWQKSIQLNLEINYQSINKRTYDRVADLYGVKANEREKFENTISDWAKNTKNIDDLFSSDSKKQETFDIYMEKKGYKLMNELNIHKIATVFEEFNQILMLPKLNNENAVISMVTYFENFLSDLLYFRLSNKNENIKSSYTITFENIHEFENTSELIDTLINKDISILLNKSFKEMLNEFVQPYDKDFYHKTRKYIFELFARRNAIIHSKSFVNDKYLQSCGNPLKLKKESEIITTTEYILEQSNRLLTLAIILINSEILNVNIKELETKVLDKFVDIIEKSAFDQLKSHNWFNSFYIYKKLKNIEIYKEQKESYTLNYLLAGKNIKDHKALQEIGSYNYNSKKIDYVLGYLAINLDYRKILETLEHSKEEIQFDEWSLNTWPIFFELKTSNPTMFKKVLEAFKKAKNKQNS